MIRRTLILGLLSASLAAPECVPAAEAVQSLTTDLGYQNRSSNAPQGLHFTVLKRDPWTFLKLDNMPENSEPNWTLIYIWSLANGWETANCYISNWRQCLADWSIAPERGPSIDPTPALTALANRVFTMTPACKFDLTIPVWKPAPDSPAKRAQARAVLGEVLKFEPEVREVYVEDFRPEDHQFVIYVKPEHHEPFNLGCVLEEPTHCSWHMFGTVTMESTRDVVLARPYRIYPDPMGPVPPSKRLR